MKLQKPAEMTGSFPTERVTIFRFARLGYDANDALQLAESALVYKHVGDQEIYRSSHIAICG